MIVSVAAAEAVPTMTCAPASWLNATVIPLSSIDRSTLAAMSPAMFTVPVPGMVSAPPVSSAAVANSVSPEASAVTKR